ncbi:tetratricopeptide repeat protein [Methanomassiliicoccus luminyensis]|jgi:tetratricopeptide (TPR) repeat protein|uniref:tetratricopeptide repeat protein n=1 Tax=Methanomassiliicoccus luminyensis TaxID=1080712 RepID=UPI000379E19A|nr:hypothetical protein [Methanomassiliicoccus luminyensis]
MPGTLTVGERIILHLSQYSKFKDSYDAPFDISQDGIAAALRISRAHAAIELKKLKETGEVVEDLVHIKKGKTKRKVYFVSPAGEDRAARIKQFAESEGIDVRPFLDIRKCKGPEVWGSLDDELKTLFAQACVFRRPFMREALPETPVSLLPVDGDGTVDLPPELKAYVVGMVAPDLLKQYHSFAADYWLTNGDYRERLFHLLSAGRAREAEMLLSSRGSALLASADRDLMDIVWSFKEPSPRYRGRVLYAQAESARRAGEPDRALAKAEELLSSSDPRDRFDGAVVKGLALRERGDAGEALAALYAARDLHEGEANIPLECDIAETLMLTGQPAEARVVLERLISGGVKDGELLERIFYQLGTISLRAGDGAEAVRLFSKSRGASRDRENGELYMALSDAYVLMGMPEKATEFAARAKRVKGSRSGP